LGARTLLWKWDKERIVRLTRAAFRTGRHPAVWRPPSGVVIRNPGNDDYPTMMAYHSRSLHSCIGKVVKKVATELLSEEVERRWLPMERHHRSWKGQSVIDAAAILFLRDHSAWTNSHLTGLLLMDIKVAFPIVT
jgi:hypothetical protein